MTAADAFRSDPRLAQARALLLDALAEHQAGIAGPRPPASGATLAYQDLLDDLADLRGAPLFYPYVGSGFGNGPWVELADGSVKLDFITGIGPHGWGHGHPDLVAAGLTAATEDLVMQGNLQQNVVSRAVMSLLVELARLDGGRQLQHVFLTTAGAMANENALKMIFQRHHPADRLLAFEGCFAGRTLGTAWVTDKAAYRDGLPQTLAVDHVPFPRDGASGAACVRAIAELRHRHPDRHAGLVAELVQGEGGYYPCDPGAMRAVFDTCRSAGIAVLIDEVQTFGRLSRPFAAGHFELLGAADLVTVGKITQVCATLFSADYRPRPGLISQTFTGATAALHAAQAILTQMRDGDLFGDGGRCMTIGRDFAAGIAALRERLPGRITGPTGIGAMCACTPLDGDGDAVRALAQDCFARGLIGFIAGSDPCRLRFLPPPAVTTSEHVATALDLLAAALEAA